MYSQSLLIYSIICLPPAPPLSLHHRNFLSSLRSFLSSLSVRYGSVFHLCCTVSFGDTRVFSSYSLVVLVEGTLVRYSSSFVVLVEGTLVCYSSCRTQYISVGPVPFRLPSINLRSLPPSYSTWFHFWWFSLVVLSLTPTRGYAFITYLDPSLRTILGTHDLPWRPSYGAGLLLLSSSQEALQERRPSNCV